MSFSAVTITQPDSTTIVLKNEYLEVWFSTLGAAILKLLVKDKNDQVKDVVLGYESLEDYTKYQGYLGAVVGRCANRIKEGKFELNGKFYQLPINNGPNCNHGGIDNFSFRHFNWIPNDSGVTFYIASANGDEGFPATLMLMVNYVLENETLKIQYVAAANEDTMCNFTNHTYFNLSGFPKSIKDHTLKVASSRYGKVDADGLATGEICLSNGTVFDFAQEKAIGIALESDDEQIQIARGLDHPFLLDQKNEQAVLYCEQTGIEMTVSTTLPVMQLYSANYVGGEPGKDGNRLEYQSGICFECQYMPDEINLNPLKAGTILRKGESWVEETSFQFKVRTKL